MPVINFPSSPSNNELFIAQGKSMRYNSAKNKWNQVGTLTAAQVSQLENNTVGVSSMSISGNTLVIQKDDSTHANVSLASFAGNILTNYASASQLPITNLVSGTQVYVEDTDSLFITDGSGWFKVATVNLSPSLALGVSSISLNTGGSVDVNYTVNEPEDTPYTITASATSNATITVYQANNTITFDTPVAATTETITITASDGVNTVGDTLSMTINLGPAWGGVTQLTEVIRPSSGGDVPDQDDHFGSAVTMSGDGNFIAVGAQGDGGNGNSFYYQGEVWIYKANAGQTAWSISGFQTAGIQAPFNAVARQIGSYGSISFDGTGTYLSVGAPNTSHNGQNNWGYAYIYKNDGTDYFGRVALLYQNASGAASQFGATTKISYDGDMLLINAPMRTVGSVTNAGTVYVYTRSGSTWTNTQTIEQSASDAANDDKFGSAMDMTKTKTYAIIGTSNISGGVDAGKAYIYTISGGILSQQAKLTPSDGVINDGFGCSVAINDAGDIAAVGTYEADVGSTPRAGAMYIYTRSGTTWSQVQKITQPVALTQQRFGFNVAMNGDGKTLFISERGLNPNSGKIHVYKLSGGTYTLEESLTTAANAASNGYGESMACDHAGELVVGGTVGHVINGNTNAGKAVIHKAT